MWEDLSADNIPNHTWSSSECANDSVSRERSEGYGETLNLNDQFDFRGSVCSVSTLNTFFDFIYVNAATLQFVQFVSTFPALRS